MYNPSALAYSVLALALLGALAALVRGLRARWLRIRAGRAEVEGAAADGPAVFLGRPLNLRTFFVRGALTARLWKRPAAGLAHTLLFVGALVAIAGHAAFGLEFVGVDVYRDWPVALLTRWGREFAGIAMLLGVAFFLPRRLGRLPRLVVGGERAGFTPMELLLLAALASGFVTEASRLAVPGQNLGGEFFGALLARAFSGLSPQALEQTNMAMWWGHGMIGIAFIALIGRTPLAHMLLGPTNSALAGRRAGIQQAPIDFDAADAEPVLGAARLADMPRKMLLDFDACVGCGRCHEACPAAQTGKALSPKRVMMIGGEFQQQGRAEDAALLDAIGAEAIFDCTTCAACVEQCPVSNSPAEAILELRRHLVMERSEMPETLALANRNLESRGHPFVGTAANPDDWRKGLEVPVFEPGATEYLLWIGCAARYEERAQKTARALVQVLQAAGVSFGIFEEARCTGDPAKIAGNEIQFVEMARDNIEAMQESKVQKVITFCAHCFNSFDRYYPELGGRWQTIAHAVLLERLVAEGRLKPAQGAAGRITYHDPCYLARHNGIVDEPRRVLAALGSLREMPRNRMDSMCCGAGGAKYWSGDKTGNARIHEVRSREAAATGADKIVTACSYCLLMLGSSSAVAEGKAQVVDIAELVAEALPAAAPSIAAAPEARA
ncbi:MAG: (Fe-S)-binding protein [Rubrivivax sp.]